MSNPYTTKTISNYNTSPPPDDGTAVAANQLSWAKHKEKLGDPIKTLAEAINTENVTAHSKFLGYDTNAQSANYTILASDEWKVIEATNAITITLLPAVTAADGFTIIVFNNGTNVVTIDGDASETINDQTSVLLSKQGDCVVLQCNGTNWKIVADSRTSYEVAINEAKGTDIASATTTDIGAATGNYVEVTGTTTITGLGTVQAGTRRIVRFTGSLTLTHNATSLILPGEANIITVANDRAEFISLGSGNWLCSNFQTASSIGGTGNYIGFQVFTASGTWTPTAGTNSVEVEVVGGGGGGGGADSAGVDDETGGGGGGQGEIAYARIASGLGATETITIGGGGSAGSTTGGNGGTGGTSSFGSHVTAIGGGGGTGTGSAPTPSVVEQGGLGGTGGTGSDKAIRGQAGGPSSTVNAAAAGGAGGGLGGGQGGYVDTNAGDAGQVGDSGGGGGGGASSTSTGAAGGAGGAGYIIVREYS